MNAGERTHQSLVDTWKRESETSSDKVVCGQEREPSPDTTFDNLAGASREIGKTWGRILKEG